MADGELFLTLKICGCQRFGGVWSTTADRL